MTIEIAGSNAICGLPEIEFRCGISFGVHVLGCLTRGTTA
jgi:hypothetical protein